MYKTAIKQVRGEPVSIGDLFSGGSVFLSMLGFNIIFSIAFGIGIALCILPGILVAGLLFAGPALVADGVPLGDAFSRSWNAMKQDMWNAAGLLVVMGLLIFVSALPCGLGMFVTLPMTYLVAALAYRDIIGMPGVGQAAPAYGTAAPGVWPPAPNTMPPPPQWGSTPADAPPPYPGYAPQPSPPPGPSFGTTPEPPATPPGNPSGSSEEPPASPWQPRPPQGQ